MEVLLIILTVMASIGVGWSIGANDAANSLGTAVGAKVLTLKQAIIRISIFGLLGAVLQGSHVTKTIGKGIVKIGELPGNLPTYVAMVASLAACAWVAIATYRKIPISTSHSMVGAIAGCGLAIGAPIKWSVMRDIFTCWCFTPLGAMILGYLLFTIIEKLAARFISPVKADRIFRNLLIVSGCYVAYSWGANDVANATGVIAGAGIFSVQASIIIGGLAIVAGIMTWGYKVIETIGSGITHLIPIMAFSAELASAINVHIYTILGMPVSTSHSIVGAIMGVGLVRGVTLLNLKIMREIIVCWLATPLITGILSFVIMALVMKLNPL